MNRKLIACFMLSLSLFSCGGGSTLVGNPPGGISPSKLVVFGKLNNGSSQIKVPLGALGSATEDAIQSEIDIYKNGKVLSILEGKTYYNTTEQAAIFGVSSLESKDIITLLVKQKTGKTLVYGHTAPAQDVQADSFNCDTTQNAALQLICGTCNKLTSCFSTLTAQQCLIGLSSDKQVQLGDEWGVPVEENSLSSQEIIESVDQGLFKADANVLKQCLNYLGALSCSEADTGYSSSQPDDFNNVENLYPNDQTCGVFGLAG